MNTERLEIKLSKELKEKIQEDADEQVSKMILKRGWTDLSNANVEP